MKSSLLPFVHSTFRDAQGKHLLPNGLQWSLPGTSHVRFVLPPGNNHDCNNEEDGDNLEGSFAFRNGVVQAYNRWCFAKDLNQFKTVQDISSIARDGPWHFQVRWKEKPSIVEKIIRFEDVAQLLQEDARMVEESSNEFYASDDESSMHPYEVWIQGEYVGPLHAGSIQAIISSIPPTENRLAYKKSPGRIRIERYYRGLLRKAQAWDHIWDNLVALEDPKLLDNNDINGNNALIGSATLKDWVMGGYLTSRLYIRDQGESILFLRPLRNDDLLTSDRRYELKPPVPSTAAQGSSIENADVVAHRMEKVRLELERLRYLATL